MTREQQSVVYMPNPGICLVNCILARASQRHIDQCQVGAVNVVDQQAMSAQPPACSWDEEANPRERDQMVEADQGHLLKNRVSVRDSSIVTIEL